MSKYSKTDKKLMKELLDNLYKHHQKLNGGSAFTDFLHGFVVPFKELGGLIPVVGKYIQPIADSVDKMIPGRRFETISDALAGKKIEGTGKRGRGRPKKVPEVPAVVVQEVVVVKKKRGRPKKV